MALKYVFNVFTGKFDLVNGGETTTIPELTSDPTSPGAEEAWVLRSGGSGGTPIGLLLALTMDVGTPATYQFSYRTTEGTTVRTTLS